MKKTNPIALARTGTIFTIAILILAACSPAAQAVSGNTPTPTENAQLPGTGPQATSTLAAGNPTTGTPVAKTPAGSPEATPTGAFKDVTPADNGATLTLQPGDRFGLKLGDTAQWTVNVADQNIVSRVVNITTVLGEQGVYEAHRPGKTRLTATSDGGDRFSIAILVQGAVQTPTPPTNPPVGFNSLRMVTAAEGWALGGPPVSSSSGFPQTAGVYHTTDGGQTWQDVTPVNLALNLMTRAFFLDEQTAWLVYSDLLGGSAASTTVFHTADGGANWERSETLQVGDGIPVSLAFLPGGQTGWMVVTSGPGAGSEGISLYRSQDGGLTWQAVMVSDRSAQPATPGSLPASCIKSGVVFNTPQQGWASGSCPGGPLFFFTSIDGGQTWSRSSLPVPNGQDASLFVDCMCSPSAPVFLDPQNGFMALSVFTTDQPQAYLYMTADGGQAWTPSDLPVDTMPTPPDFVNPQDGWLTDGAQLYATQDGGQSWTQVGPLPVENIADGLNFVDAQTGFLTDGQDLYETRDGGASWQEIQFKAVDAPGSIGSPAGLP